MDLPLRELRIHGFADLTIPRLLPYISSITSLHVHFICDGIIDMGLLLENCPYLEQISLQSNALLTLPGPWILGEKVLRKRSLLPLRRFDLRGVQLPQSCLESLLMVTPYIRQLVIHISRPTMSGVYAFDESRLANFAKQHCQNLESFHCSNRENSSMIIEFLKPCSTSLHLERIVHVFRGVEIGRRHIQSPQPRSELLTKIEILISCPSICRYLSALPNLIYLKAPQTNIPWKEVDVHLRQLHGRVASGFPQLWACRNLQTLHIGMETYESSLVAARTIFGYISTLCPKLRDLEITKIDYCKPYPSNHRPEPLWPTLESGFCLLGRLKYLERLRVGNINVNIKLPCWHWDWIILSPDTKIEAAKHHKRLKVIKTWKSMLEEEARRDRLRLQNMCFLEGIQDPTAHLDGDNQIKAQLSHLGLLRDVVIFLENMHRNDNVEEEGCLKRWPRLQRLSVYHAAPFGQSTEKEVERLILAGAVDMSVELSAILSRHSYALIAFMSIAVLAAVLDLPLQSYVPLELHSLPHSPFKGVKISPLGIVEILERVIEFVDEFFISRIIILVCKQWFHIGRKRVLREVVWDSRWNNVERDVVLQKLPGAGRLTFFCVPGNNEGLHKTALLSAMSRCQNQVTTEPRPLMSTQLGGFYYSLLRELSLSSGPELHDLDLFPFPSSITKLQLDMYHKSAHIMNISILLKKCPSLMYLRISRRNTLTIDGKWIPADHDPQKSLPLRSLILRNVAFIQSDLEELLTITRNLSELKLYDVPDNAVLRGEMPILVPVNYDWKRLVEHINHIGITLNSFHMSNPNLYRSTRSSQQDMIRACPNSNEWILWSPDANLSMLQELETLPNIITTVELCWGPLSIRNGHSCTQKHRTNIPRLLHRYLCQSPHLRHLKVLSALFLLEAMDYHTRAGHLDSAEDRLPQPRLVYDPEMNNTEWPDDWPGIWACRGLRSLKIEVHSHRRYLLKSELHSRILFGYISRVCPMLEELEVTVPFQCSHGWQYDTYLPELSLRLDGGLCLLSRLKHLRRLHICPKAGIPTIDYNEIDLNWIIPEGHQDKYRKQRQQIIEGWKEKIEVEMRLEKRRLELTEWHRPQLSSLQDSIEPELIQKLENLGLLLDVKAMVEEMNAPGYLSFPNLERLSLNNTLGRNPVNFFRQTFRHDQIKA
ncbi:hypothetical protein FBU30_002529 [Linnemannia zychae]|nr:hypothetical protein FBU30_002529 [Linnemannia zychae]